MNKYDIQQPPLLTDYPIKTPQLMIEYPQTILMHNHIEGAEELDSKKVFFLNNLVPTIEP